ncbi:hypothetical protein B0H19DRAFT_1263672 [Mycena capillaripes]|nr:hypothetical protein B0H19DRAFT_1263672 [Mycena capillaripes]
MTTDSAQTIDYSTKLAPEVWLRCLHGASASDIASIASACRYFQELCQPLLFQNMGLRVRKLPEAIEHAKRSKTRLEELAAGSHVVSVRSWTFSLIQVSFGLKMSGARHSPYLQVAKSYFGVIHTFCTTLGFYRNLRSLSLHGAVIGASLRATISSLMMLQELNLTDSMVVPRAGTLLDIPTFSLSVSPIVDQQATQPIQPLHLVSPTTLRTLTLDGSREAATFLVSILQLGVLDNLERISVQLSDLILIPFLKLLEYCPRLGHIDVHRGSALSLRLPDRLLSSIMPSLRSFKGPHTIAGLFTFGRPVVSVELIGALKMQGILSRSIECLSQSSATLRSLFIVVPVPVAHDLAGSITGCFPQLEELSLSVVAIDPDHTEPNPHRAMAALIQQLFSVHDVTASPFMEFVQRLCAGDVPLPAGLVLLIVRAVRMSHDASSLSFPMEQQCAIVRALARQDLPVLNKIVLGDSDGTWTRRGDLWTEW